MGLGSLEHLPTSIGLSPVVVEVPGHQTEHPKPLLRQQPLTLNALGLLDVSEGEIAGLLCQGLHLWHPSGELGTITPSPEVWTGVTRRKRSRSDGSESAIPRHQHAPPGQVRPGLPSLLALLLLT